MIAVSTDKDLLDVDFIHRFLTDIYWAKGRTVQEVRDTIRHSYCFGIYLDGKQVGFARLATDFTVFAYLMDVFISEVHRGNGYSSILMEYIMNDPKLASVKIWRLATSDSHFLYKKFGFSSLAHPEKLMEKIIAAEK
jgi:N-acetylglutamate synthase-like GNAT family acetyltransferase